MPIYEYVCLDCGYRFDELRPMSSADAPIDCTKCHSGHTSRLISVFIAQSGGHIVAGGNSGGCDGCSGGTCSTCGH